MGWYLLIGGWAIISAGLGVAGYFSIKEAKGRNEAITAGLVIACVMLAVGMIVAGLITVALRHAIC